MTNMRGGGVTAPEIQEERILQPTVAVGDVTQSSQWRTLTLQDVDRGAVISLLDHTAALGQAGGIHTVHDGEDLYTLANIN